MSAAPASLLLVLVAAPLAALSGPAALALRRRPARAQRAAATLVLAAAALGLAGAALALAGHGGELRAAWHVPFGALAFRLDALSALFLLPIFGLGAAGAVYGLGYYSFAARGSAALRLAGWYGLVVAAMAVLVLAANAMLFLAAWEIMALCGFLLVLTEHERPEAQAAAFAYLAAAHVGTLALFALFSLLGARAGSFDFAAIAAARPAPGAGVLVLLLGGFGLKAGLMPLHFWLPGAHAAAPSHVSALMSGVLLKTGIYGILRVTGLLAAPPLGWGLAVLALGAVSAVLGVAFALAQHDVKRLLAYHSVENVGIIAMGVGLGLVGRAAGDPALVLLGFAGGALHVVNHALFKGLLFLGAGAVAHATGTRELDLLGGLGRRMPRTAALFLVGAAAISGLPPLNGFVSEWLVVLAALAALASPSLPVAAAALAAPVLALVGGLAAACFAKVHGTVFLGTARSEHGADAHDPPPSMLLPMAALAAPCAAIGLLAPFLVPALARAAADWSGLPPEALAPAAASGARSAFGITAVAAVGIVAAGLLARARTRRLAAAGAAEAVTWDCGYARPSPRMQYTGSSFAEMLTLRFGWAFAPRAHVEPPQGPFPRRASFSSHVPDTVLDAALLPALAAAAGGAGRLRRLHRGQVQGQALLVAVALVALLAWRFLAW